jgi:N-acetylneuraminate epimerase
MFIKKLLAASLLISAVFSIPAASAATLYPEFPVAFKMGASAKVGQKIFAGLGSAGKSWYVLDLSAPEKQWQALADFPDMPRDAANAVAVGNRIYVFAGQGKINPSDKNLVIFDTVYQYDIDNNSWSKVTTRTPQGLLASAALTLDGENILFFGGVNKQIFDGYFQDYFITADNNKPLQDEVANRYFNQRPQDYLFTAQVLSYNPKKNQWRNIGMDPNPVTIGTGIAVKGNRIHLVGGEIKPGLRSPAVKQIVVKNEDITWKKPVNMPPAHGDMIQEGIAGAYAGYSHDVLIAAGGANFPGAWKQYQAGQLFAHQGLKKTWRDDIYAEVKGKWIVAGKLPVAMGYGTYVQLDDGVLVVGGELQGGAASKDVFLLRWNGKQVEAVR